MKITKYQLIKLIREAVYFPAYVSKEDLDYNAEMRSNLSNDQKRKVDALSNDPEAHANLMSNLYLGGSLKDKESFDPVGTVGNVVPKQNFVFSTELASGKTGYGDYIKDYSPKDALIEMDTDIFDYTVANGQRIFEIGSMEIDEDAKYIIPLSEIYKFMSLKNVSKDVIDFALEIGTETEIEYIHGEPYIVAYDF